MIKSTKYTINKSKLSEIENLNSTGKISINEPTGDFFYDPWKIKPEYAGTVFEEVLSVLPDNIGEARLITLQSGTCYFSHSDIDDRYHLNISGDCAALINIDTTESWFLTNDGIWYDMDASPLHSAVNYGQYDRKQIVVRKLLNRNKLKKATAVTITIKGPNPRFLFDNTISKWLNLANKQGIISNFSTDQTTVSFFVEEEHRKDLEKLIPESFDYEYNR